MEQFNNNIFKLRKEIVDITFDLSRFKKRNHKTIKKILNNLNTIHEISKIEKTNFNINIIKNNKIQKNTQQTIIKIIYAILKTKSLEKNRIS